MAELVHGAIPELRVHPARRRVRAQVDGRTVVDSTRALVVWEPRRVVASYAVPVDDVAGELVPFEGPTGQERPVRMGKDAPPVLDPGTPFPAALLDRLDGLTGLTRIYDSGRIRIYARTGLPGDAADAGGTP